MAEDSYAKVVYDDYVKKIDMNSINDGKVTSSSSSHLIGTTLGTIGGMAAGASAAVVAGAAVGSAAGPVGTVLGAVLGGGIGAGVGHKIAGEVNPKAEDQFWRENFGTRPYVVTGGDFEEYQPAYRYGVQTYIRHPDIEFELLEPSLSADWKNWRGSSKLGWHIARHAIRDAYEKVKNFCENRMESDYRSWPWRS